MPQAVAAVVAAFSATAAAVSSAVAAGAAAIGFSAGTAAAIGTAVVKIGSNLLVSAAITALSPKPKIDYSGMLQTRTGPLQPRAIVLGRAAVAGACVTPTPLRFGYSSKKFAVNYYALSGAGRCGTVEQVIWGEDTVTFSANEAVGKFNNSMYLHQQPGDWNQNALIIPSGGDWQTAGPSEWPASRRMAGCMTAALTIKYTQAVFEGNVQQPVFVVRADQVALVDPRTGAAATTWAQMQNPAVHAYSWALGHRAPNGKLLLGLGHTAAELHTASFAYAANVADANNWTVSGELTTAEDRYEALAAILQACASMPVERAGQTGVVTSAISPVVGIITSDDLRGDPVWRYPSEQSSRPNAIQTRWRDPASRWQVIDGKKVTDAAYVTADGGREKVATVEYPLAGGGSAHVGHLAGLDLVNSREPLEFELPCKQTARYQGFTGECVELRLPEIGLAALKCRIDRRQVNDDGTVDLTLRVETDSKYAWAATQTSAAPALTLVPGFDPGDVPQPTGWAAAAAQIAQGGNELPIIRVTGTADDFGFCTGIVVKLRLPGAAQPWLSSESYPAAAQSMELRGLTSSTAYVVGVAYRGLAGNEGPVLELGPVTTGALSVTNVPLLTGPASTVFRATTNGAPVSGQLPRSLQFNRALGGTDVTASTTWSVDQVTGCTVSIGAATGLASISAVTAGTGGSFRVNATRDGVTLRQTVAVNLDSTAAFFNQPTAPASANDGDTWRDSDAVPVALYLRAGGAWVYQGQEGADITILNTPTLNGPASTLFRADTNGALVSGQLPRAIQYDRLLGATNVTASTTWSVDQITGCTVSIGAATGLASISAVTAGTGGSFRVNAARDGVTLSRIVTVDLNSTAAFFNQPTAPASANDGDTWRDSDAVPVALYLRAGGVWEYQGQEGADITILNTPTLNGPAATVFRATTNGDPVGGQLPRAIQYDRLLGANNVTASTTWSVDQVTGCTVSIGAATGLVSITALSGNAGGSFRVNAARDGVTLSRTVNVGLNSAATFYNQPSMPSGGLAGDIWRDWDAVPVALYLFTDGVWVYQGQEGADITILNTPTLNGPASTLFRADTNGALVSGQLPRAIQYDRLLGANSVTASTTWSVDQVTGCTVSIGAATGLASISAVAAGTGGSFRVNAARDGVTLSRTVNVGLNSTAAFFNQPSLPAAANDGDFWRDSDAVPVALYLRAGGVWTYQGQEGADITAQAQSVVTGPVSLPINVDDAGVALSGQLPRAFSMARLVGGVDVTASTTWSVASASAGVTVTGGSGGAFSLTAIGTGAGHAIIRSVQGGLTIDTRVDVIANTIPGPDPRLWSMPVVNFPASAVFDFGLHAGKTLLAANGNHTLTIPPTAATPGTCFTVYVESGSLTISTSGSAELVKAPSNTPGPAMVNTGGFANVVYVGGALLRTWVITGAGVS